MGVEARIGDDGDDRVCQFGAHGCIGEGVSGVQGGGTRSSQRGIVSWFSIQTAIQSLVYGLWYQFDNHSQISRTNLDNRRQKEKPTVTNESIEHHALKKDTNRKHSAVIQSQALPNNNKMNPVNEREKEQKGIKRRDKRTNPIYER